MARIELTWSAIEYHYAHKTVDWYWAVGIIALSIAATSIILGDVLFAFFILISAFALCLVAAREPGMLLCEVSDRGIVLNGVTHTFTTLQSFWVENPDTDNPSHIPKLILRSKKIFMPYIVIPIDGVEPDEVRETLLTHLPEKEHLEPLSLKIMERLGF